MRIIRVGGFFSGIGAHHSACERVASEEITFEVVFQCEIDKKTELAYNHLHGLTGSDAVPNLQDITKVHDIGGALAVDILFWTPPCQDISCASMKKKGNEKGSGTRSALAFEVPRILGNTPERERPRYLVMEEVPMMIHKDFINNFNDLLGELSDLGYSHRYGVLNSSDYGVAQSRRRLFVISKLGGVPPELPKPVPLTKCLEDYLDSEPVPEKYFMKEERVEKMIWSTSKERERERFCLSSDRSERDCKNDHLQRGREEDRQLSVIIEARPRARTYANKGRVYGARGLVLALSAHMAKDAEYLVVSRLEP